MARYQAPGSPDLYAGEVRMPLDFTPGGGNWTDMGSGQVLLSPTGPAAIDTRSVPDPSKLLQQTRAASAQPFPTMAAAPAAGFGTAGAPGFAGTVGPSPPAPPAAPPPGYTPPTSYAPAASWPGLAPPAPTPPGGGCAPAGNWYPQAPPVPTPPAAGYIPMPSLPPATGAAPPAAGPVQPIIIQRSGSGI